MLAAVDCQLSAPRAWGQQNAAHSAVSFSFVLEDFALALGRRLSADPCKSEMSGWIDISAT
jgi:hypothetical protein